MNWQNLLDRRRLCDANYVEKPDRPTFIQDADRITFSAPFRRLANKTQVHPLYENDHLHHRLIHSVETASVGRSLGIAVGDWLEKEHGLREGEKHVVAGMTQAACLAHDIGNPPFGHSGEAAIGSWFTECFRGPSEMFGAIEAPLRLEFEDFEGNAQGFRIISRLEMYRNAGGMRLSLGVLGAFAKYPVTARVRVSATQPYCGLKKFGVFESDAKLFAQVAEAVGLPAETIGADRWWRRHPLVFLVEAADDICYNILDLEDAYASGDLPEHVVLKLLQSLAGIPNVDLADRTTDEIIAYARARAIGSAIDACVAAFKANYDGIMSGSFSGSLIEASAKSSEFAAIKKLSKQRLFTSPRKTELEVFGRNIVHRVLDGLIGVFEQLRAGNWDPAALDGYHEQLRRAANLDLRDVKDEYTALHALTDYVSGMTDRYAVKIAKLVAGG
ncbi:dGTP triphosphohydrolase [Agrobacterium tumefaciens]|uniref:dGTP triphosphohydrolase n=1 Tax=Agrobacterium tumefaciens TaxID=358 RepID=UPI001FAAD89A|nr:dNTP triphosphohydrolase [Agrobacterium tumefaciens]UNZ53831.1 dNTP triphosphohydrolase [Agrobacterium tumefaciens]